MPNNALSINKVKIIINSMRRNETFFLCRIRNNTELKYIMKYPLNFHKNQRQLLFIFALPKIIILHETNLILAQNKV